MPINPAAEINEESNPQRPLTRIFGYLYHANAKSHRGSISDEQSYRVGTESGRFGVRNPCSLEADWLVDPRYESYDPKRLVDENEWLIR